MIKSHIRNPEIMNKSSFNHLDNLIDNWDSNTDRFYLCYEKLDKWCSKQTLKFVKKYEKKLKNLDLFKKIEFTLLYEDSETKNLIVLAVSAEKQGRGNNEIKFEFSPNIFLLSNDDEVENASFKESKYFHLVQTDIMSFKLNICNDKNNTETLLNKFEKMSYGRNIKFLQMEGLNVQSGFEGRLYYDRPTYEIDKKGNYKNESSLKYLEYKKSSSKKLELHEKFLSPMKMFSKKAKENHDAT